MSEQETYEKFIEWLGRTWWGLPESDQLMPIIKARYTVKEAEFLTGMPFSGSSLEELAELKGKDPDELGSYLDDLAQKGVIFRNQRDDTVRYSLNDSQSFGKLHCHFGTNTSFASTYFIDCFR